MCERVFEYHGSRQTETRSLWPTFIYLLTRLDYSQVNYLHYSPQTTIILLY